MTDQPQLRQCGAVRRQDDDVLRCGRPAIHVEQDTDHGDWVKIGALDPEHDGIPLGRILDALWHDVGLQAPQAWLDPDPAGRSVEPPISGQIPHGVEVTPLGTRGKTMASIEEVKAAMGGAKAQLAEIQAIVRDAINRLDTAAQAINAAIEGSGHQAAHEALTLNGQAKDRAEETIQLIEAEIEQLDTYAGGL